MVEQRYLTRAEFNQLLKEAPEDETMFIRDYLKGSGVEAYDFFEDFGFEKDGIVIDGRPIYVAILTGNEKGEKELWTIVNSDVKEQFTLYKISKRQVYKWLEKYKRIFSTMQKINPKNLEWVKRLGFKQTSEEDDTITFVLS